jgi:transposase
MSNPRHPEDLKIQTANQVTEKKMPVTDVVARLGIASMPG